LSEGPYVLGIDYGTESVRVGIFDLEGTPVVFAAEAYSLKHPHSGWAEQDPDEWWSCLVKATRRALDEGNVASEEIAGLSVDATTCTVVALDRQERILRPAIMWMDVRAVDQAVRVQETEDPALKYNGFARVSAEWMPSKALWLKEREPDTYENAEHICECLDWVTYRLTGEWTASINTASFRWYYDRNEGGFPESLYVALGLDDLLDKFPPRVLDMGTVAGELRKEAAEELGLPAGVPVAEGGGDAFVALVGLNVLEPRKMALITGSSHVVVGQAAEPKYGAGLFGAYTDGIVPGQYSVEGGQASTGSVVKWFKDNFAKRAGAEAERRGVDAYEVLGEMAAEVPPGSEGLMVLDYWQGNRTPHTDPEARGMMWGSPSGTRRGTSSGRSSKASATAPSTSCGPCARTASSQRRAWCAAARPRATCGCRCTRTSRTCRSPLPGCPRRRRWARRYLVPWGPGSTRTSRRPPRTWSTSRARSNRTPPCTRRTSSTSTSTSNPIPG
jgi:ribulose kinase